MARQSLSGCWIVLMAGILLCGFLVCLFILGGPDKPFELHLDDSPEAQQERLYLIQKLRNQGVFHKVKWFGAAPKIWVTPRFMLLDVDTKRTFCELVYAYYAVEVSGFGDDRFDFVGLKSSLDDSNVGTYRPSQGLDMK